MINELFNAMQQDHKWLVCKDLEGSDLGLFRCILRNSILKKETGTARTASEQVEMLTAYCHTSWVCPRLKDS